MEHNNINLYFPYNFVHLTYITILISITVISTAAESPAGIYTAIAPKLIRPNSTYNISLFVEPRINGDTATPLNFQAAILSTKENYTARESIQILPGHCGVLTIQTEELTAESYNLSLKIKDGMTKETEDVTTIFPKKDDKAIILLHSDKSTYKPGETVQFRVVHLTHDLKPFPTDAVQDRLLEVRIIDPEQNVIKIWDNVQPKMGLFSAKLQLSSEPVLGDWKIEVKPIPQKPKLRLVSANNMSLSAAKSALNIDSESDEDGHGNRAMFFPGRKYRPRPRPERDSTDAKSLKFVVAQYVLPKFQVTVKLPPFLTLNQTTVSVETQAKYTYGKAVKGECTLTPRLLYPRYHYHSTGPDSDKDKVISKTFPIDGSAVTEIETKHLYPGDPYEQDLVFDAQVTETVTGKSENGTAQVHMHQYPYKIEQIVKTEFLKPGLPFSIIFKILTQDNKPISDPAPNALKIQHGFSYKANRLETSIPPNGLVNLTFDTPTNEWITVSQIRVTYKDLHHDYYVPQRYHSGAQTFLAIKLLGENGEVDPILEPTITANSKFTIHVNATTPFSTLNYLIVGDRQEIFEFKKVNLPGLVNEYRLELTCPIKAPPEAKLIVYILNDKNEIVADSLKFSAKHVEQDLENYLNVNIINSEATASTFEPGQNICLKLQSKPNSLVALRGVDQSVLLLKEPDVDIKQKSVDDLLKSKYDELLTRHRVWGGSNTFQIFEQGGLVILSNAKIEIEKPVPIRPWRPLGGGISLRRGGPKMMKMANFAMADAPVAMGSFAAKPQILGKEAGGEEIRIRTEFPETWLWEEVSMNGSNTLDFHKTVPDTLTSWIITGYSLNTDSGLGILSQPQKLTVFRPFFISLNLPYSVVKGEVLVLQVLVHNYLPSEGSTSAEIILENSKHQFQFNDKSLQDASQHTKTVSCPPNSVTAVTFVITPTELGSIMLNIRGMTHNPSSGSAAGDALSQALRVKPPGQQQRRAASVIIRTGQDVSPKNPEATLNTSFPRVRVPGADTVKVSFISDILGSTIANLDKMLQIPTGCGEQNMLNFVADIVILDYLKNTQNLDEKVKAKAINFLEIGYQRELTYRHADGSFSAFGSSDSQGSTWLTAFVVRSFIQAKRYITIDDHIIASALEFLAKKQFDNGGLFENGKVIHSEMQGGSSSSGISLTAYTVLAFIEASQHWAKTGNQGSATSKITDYSSNVQKGLNYVTSQIKTVSKEDPYTTVLTTYALHLANHPQKDKFFTKLQLLATTKGGLTFWETNRNKSRLPNGTEHHHHRWEIVTRPVSVEMTGYALLTYILNGNVAESFPLVKWLLKERNAKGGFHSTQDTVVGLTALAKYAELTKDNVTDLQVKASYNSVERTVTINTKNAVVLQEFELPNDTSSVHVAVSGVGTVLTQLTWMYYVEDAVRDPAFAIEVKASAKSAGAMELKICTSYLRGTASNMGIIEVNLPSGYCVDKDSLGELKEVTGYKRYDTDKGETKVDIYLDAITSNRTCVAVLATRSFKVGKQAPALVNVYDYYDTTRTARAFYEAPVVSICEICQENNDCKDNNCV